MPLLSAPTRAAMEEVRAAGIRAHVRFLADDALEGRDTGSSGASVASRYLASQLEQAGVAPAGDGGTYFQQIPFQSIRFDTASSRLTATVGGKSVTYTAGTDFLFNGSVGSPVTADVPLEFVGYGITAPEFTHDDYAQRDVKGKWVVVLTGEPASADAAYFDGPKDTRHASGAAKVALARSKGAVGMITVLWGPRATRFPWDQVRRGQETAQLSLPGRRESFPALIVRPAAAEGLFAGAPTSWAAVEKVAGTGEVRGFPLPAVLGVDLKLSVATVPAPNVVGLVEGSDPELKKQVVIYSAHYDHVGRRSGEGDTIFNGAWDNASGTAEVLEIARAFAAMSVRPRRSALFLFVTGEEKGMLGSEYYTQHPVVPIEDTAANINLDMTDIFGIGKELVPQGAERSTLLRSCEAVAKELNLTIGSDPTPELSVFTRSDQFSFARVGVPCLFMRWSNEHEDNDPAATRAR
ncbi:MAG: family metallo-hydrolase, partial [Armatimonadetes bacterium]|nr:family metallo-hydrolase [Armatimonadota bacterium]